MNHLLSPLRLLLGLLLVLGAGAATAALGQLPSTPTAASAAASSSVPAAKMQAGAPGAQSGLYTRHEGQLENGTSVREYATPAGIVFAVTWQGPVLPDLSALLGNYFGKFTAEAERVRLSGRRGGPVNIAGPKLVVQSSGRMRNFYGHAYAPDLIPAGVNINDVLQ